MDHRHILLFDPVQCEREKICAETVWHAIFKDCWRVFFVHAQDPTTTFFTNIALRVCITDYRVLRIAILAPLLQRGINVSHNELVLNRDRRNFDAKHFRGALRMVARSGYDMFCGDDNLLVRRDQIAALLDHLRTSHVPMRACPFKAISLHTAYNFDAALTRALGHRHRYIRRVNIAVRRVIQSALKRLGIDQWPARFDLVRGQEFIRDAAGFGS